MAHQWGVTINIYIELTKVLIDQCRWLKKNSKGAKAQDRQTTNKKKHKSFV